MNHMKRSFSAIILAVILTVTGCTLAGGLDPNLAQRILGDLACVASLAGAYAQSQSAMPNNPSVLDVLNVINGATNSGMSARVLNSCAQLLVNAGQDIGALQNIVIKKASLERKPPPKFAPTPKKK